MELSDDEILEAADRIRTRRGLRVARECARCGVSFLAGGLERYCSEVCSDAATREHQAPTVDQHDAITGPESLSGGESIREFIVRERAKLVERGEMTADDARITDEDEAFIAATTRLDDLRRTLSGSRVFDGDSTEILREEREKRSRYQASLHGLGA